MLKRFTIFIYLFCIFNLLPVNAEGLASKLKGRILLQVEQNGEAWYVNPLNEKRYYLGRPDDAFAVMRDLGVGVSNVDLLKISVADSNLSGLDSDTDGLSNMVEDAIGTDKNSSDTDGDGFSDKDELLGNYNPIGLGNVVIDNSFATKQAGKIFLQVEQNGEAWYVNPENLKRYYLGRPIDAYNIMRSLGLGISDVNLDQIVVAGYSNELLYGVMEKNVHDLINKERIANGLSSLVWNSELANVAREHSANLAKENISLIDINVRCSLPLIHHEGTDLDFGLYTQDRLDNRGVYYLSASGENIALMPIIQGGKYNYDNTQNSQNEIEDCSSFFNNLNSDFKKKLEETTSATEKIKLIQDQISYRENLVSKQSKIELFDLDRNTNSEVEQSAVTGWMNSPGHRANILTAIYNESGVGIAEVEDYLILTQVFITKVDCGYKTGSCCKKKGYYDYCYDILKCLDNVCK